MGKMAISMIFLMMAQSGFSSADTLLSKKPIDLRSQPIWETISENDSIFPAFDYLDRLHFSTITYESDGHIVKGFMIEPKAEGIYPVVIFNRGGNRDFASLNLEMMLSYTSKIAGDGYIILASNYRDADEFGGEEINDVLKLLDICPSLDKADTSRIGMFGWSRGGMMCYMCMARTTRLKTVVVGNGPTDLAQILSDRPMLEKNVFSQCIPNYEENKGAELQKRSVVYWTDQLCVTTSLFILAGTKDERVDAEQAVRLAELLSETDISYKLELFETDHFFSDRKQELTEELLSWFEKELRNSR